VYHFWHLCGWVIVSIRSGGNCHSMTWKVREFNYTLWVKKGTSMIWKWLFVTTVISQGSVATRLRCGGQCGSQFVANFLMNSTKEKFRKSVNICQSYGQKYRGPFFYSQCRRPVGTLFIIQTVDVVHVCRYYDSAEQIFASCASDPTTDFNVQMWDKTQFHCRIW